MNANRLTITLAVLAVIAIAVATSSFAKPPKAASPSDDFALRHPAGLPGVAANVAAYYLGSDYAQRHPELLMADNSDFFLRHTEWSIVSPAIDSSDYFLRHPELLGADNSDFFLRHTEWSIMSPVIDSSDYYLRHPELTAW